MYCKTSNIPTQTGYCNKRITRIFIDKCVITSCDQPSDHQHDAAEFRPGKYNESLTTGEILPNENNYVPTIQKLINQGTQKYLLDFGKDFDQRYQPLLQEVKDLEKKVSYLQNISYQYAELYTNEEN